MLKNRFWEYKSLEEMTVTERERLCDGCGRCCLNKLEDEDSGEIYYTNVACHLLDLETCSCKDYTKRLKRVPACIKVAVQTAAKIRELPHSCAYRRLADGRPLAGWHPLVTGTPASVHEAGISVHGRAVCEEYIHPDQLPEHIILWEPAR